MFVRSMCTCVYMAQTLQVSLVRNLSTVDRQHSKTEWISENNEDKRRATDRDWKRRAALTEKTVERKDTGHYGAYAVDWHTEERRDVYITGTHPREGQQRRNHAYHPCTCSGHLSIFKIRGYWKECVRTTPLTRVPRILTLPILLNVVI